MVNHGVQTISLYRYLWGSSKAMLDSSLFIPVGFFYSRCRQPLSFRQPGDSHHLMQIPSGIGVMSSAYGVVNFVLLRTHMKLTGLMESSTSLYVTSLFLPKNTIVGN